MDTDVLVVGAGPTGLMMATLLARLGTSVMIIDRHAGPAVESRALGVQARTLEIYRTLGIVDQAIEQGVEAVAVNLWAAGRHAVRIPLGDIGRDQSPYPFVHILGQDANERLLGEALGRLGVAVRWNHELVGLAQDASGVSASVRTPDGTVHEVRAGWVAGCDGARSAVRALNGIPFDGAPYEHVFFVADTIATGTMVPGELNVFLWPSGFHLFFPMKGSDHWRVVGILPAELRGRDDARFEEVVPSMVAQAGPSLVFASCSWFSTYRIHHRRAQQFRRGRCFLLGDAAHIHSPVGAQGMNTGLQDAWNLGWKLALVAQGRAGSALLESYEAERIPVAERLLHTTDRAFAAVVSGSELVGVVRTRIMPRIVAMAMRLARVRRLVFRTVSQVGIRYRASPLSEEAPGFPEHAPRAGDRFPWVKLHFADGAGVEDFFGRLDGKRFDLLVVDQPGVVQGVAGLEGILRVHVVARDPVNAAELDRAGIPAPSFYLLRPDGHVGLAGRVYNAALVEGYVRGRLGIT